MAQKFSVGLENEEDILCELESGDVKGYFFAGWGFKLTMAMAPLHEDQQGRPKKLLKFAIINNEIQTLLKRYMWVKNMWTIRYTASSYPTSYRTCSIFYS